MGSASGSIGITTVSKAGPDNSAAHASLPLKRRRDSDTAIQPSLARALAGVADSPMTSVTAMADDKIQQTLAQQVASLTGRLKKKHDSIETLRQLLDESREQCTTASEAHAAVVSQCRARCDSDSEGSAAAYNDAANTSLRDVAASTWYADTTTEDKTRSPIRTDTNCETIGKAGNLKGRT